MDFGADGGEILTRVGETLRVRVGQEFCVELADNPSTGYWWQWVSNAGASRVGMVETEWISDDPTHELDGAGGKLLFRFVARQTGHVRLTFEHSSPGDDQQTMYVVTVEVMNALHSPARALS